MNDLPDLPPRNYSPFEPSYLRHYRKLPNDWIKWDGEVEEPRRHVGGGICATLREANVEIERAIDHVLKELAKSW